MGFVLRVRLASFFAGAATASFLGLYILHKDYKVAHESISRQVLISLSLLVSFASYICSIYKTHIVYVEILNFIEDIRSKLLAFSSCPI